MVGRKALQRTPLEERLYEVTDKALIAIKNQNSLLRHILRQRRTHPRELRTFRGWTDPPLPPPLPQGGSPDPTLWTPFQDANYQQRTLNIPEILRVDNVQVPDDLVGHLVKACIATHNVRATSGLHRSIAPSTPSSSTCSLRPQQDEYKLPTPLCHKLIFGVKIPQRFLLFMSLIHTPHINLVGGLYLSLIHI